MNIEITKPTRLLTGGKACPEDIDIVPVMQSKVVTENGVVVPDEGYLGFERVTVNVPDAVLEMLDKPMMPKFGRLKYFAADSTIVRYIDVFPTASVHDTYGVYTNTASCETATETAALTNMMNIYGNHPWRVWEKVVVNAKPYEVVRFCTGVSAVWWNCTAGDSAALSDVTLLYGVCRFVLFNPNTQTFSTKEIEMIPVTLEGVTYQRTSNTLVTAYRYIHVYGTPADYIVGVEFTYPKGDITFSGTADGLQYSADDGVTFQDVTDGLVLSQIEHVCLFNAGAVTVNVGSTAGGNQYAVLASGAKRYIQTAADGTWYVS